MLRCDPAVFLYWCSFTCFWAAAACVLYVIRIEYCRYYWHRYDEYEHKKLLDLLSDELRVPRHVDYWSARGLELFT